MLNPRKPGVAIWLLAVIVATVSIGASQADAVSVESAKFQERLDQMGRHFEAHPEMKVTPGSGWKPYNRMKWFHEQRMFEGELPPVGARWNAWEIKKEREQARGTTRATWFSLGPANLAGRMLALDFDINNPSTVYTGAAGGGVFKTTDSGANWFPISDEIASLAIGGLAVSKTDPTIIVIGTGEGTLNIDRIGGVGILRSTDSGATWITTSNTNSPGGNDGFHVVESGPNGTFLAGATDGLWRSTDDGATWTQVRVGGDYYDVKWKPGDPNTVFSVKGDDLTGNNVKISTDNGVTWTRAGNGQPASFQIGKSKLAVTPADPDRMWVFYGDAGTGGGVLGLYRTVDGGANWTNLNSSGLPSGQSWYNLILGADPNNINVLITGAVGISRSNNGGTSFFPVGGVHSDHHVIAWEPGADNTVWVGGDGGNYRSTNDGSSFSYRSNNLTTYQFYDICVNNDDTEAYYIMGGTQDQGTDKWSGTTSWAEGLGADGMVCNINPQNANVVYAEIQFGSHRKNTNFGSGGWATVNNGIPGGNGQWVVPVAQDQNQGNRLYTNHSSAGIYRTTNGANLWENVDGTGAVWIDISRVDGDVVWTVGSSVRITTNDGTTWTTAAPYGFATGGATKILAHPTDVNTAWVTFSSYSSVAHVAMTTDMGSSWTDVTGDLPDVPVNAIAVNPSNPTQWFIGTDVGCWTSNNGGTNWLPFEDGLPNSVVVDLEIQDTLQKLVAGTHGRGAWEIDIPGGATSTPEVSNGPKNLMLDAPWPNPISDRVLLRYAAKSDASVSLRVFDVQGRLVSDLHSMSTGDGVIRTTPWHTDDVSSGVYFAVLETGAERISRKLIVRK